MPQRSRRGAVRPSADPVSGQMYPDTKMGVAPRREAYRGFPGPADGCASLASPRWSPMDEAAEL